MFLFRPLRRVPWPHPRSMSSGLPLSCHWLVQPLSSIVPRRSDVQPATSSGKYSPTGSSKMRASGRISSGSFASAATISSVRSGHFSMAMGRLRRFNMFRGGESPGSTRLACVHFNKNVIISMNLETGNFPFQSTLSSATSGEFLSERICTTGVTTVPHTRKACHCGSTENKP